jgi:hypothetical protein
MIAKHRVFLRNCLTLRRNGGRKKHPKRTALIAQSNTSLPIVFRKLQSNWFQRSEPFICCKDSTPDHALIGSWVLRPFRHFDSFVCYKFRFRFGLASLIKLINTETKIVWFSYQNTTGYQKTMFSARKGKKSMAFSTFFQDFFLPISVAFLKAAVGNFVVGKKVENVLHFLPFLA